ncbi:MAG TPA: RlmE family RNA methyltransferase [Polyangia bacterium]|jgi:23S rRNA (uridine2552-2'-O)-methyltransferase|nr:RlmE family RNA methyltransferase [Polyangia bacterium]
MSKLRDPHHRHDRYFKQARAQGFAARSVFKLEEIDRKLRLLRAGHRVLDLGCRPGSWMQYAVATVGARGAVVGVDRDALPGPIAGARVLTGDIYKVTDAELLGDLTAFDVVLSDMAPDTTGVRATDQARSAALFEEALARAERLLAPGGSFVGKIFQGPDLQPLRQRMTGRFAEVRLVKPDSSRAQSIEIFLAGRGFA